MNENNYIILCRTWEVAALLFERLSEYLVGKSIYHRLLKTRLTIDVLGSHTTIRFMSEQSPHTADMLQGFRGQIVSGQKVEEWLDIH